MVSVACMLWESFVSAFPAAPRGTDRPAVSRGVQAALVYLDCASGGAALGAKVGTFAGLRNELREIDESLLNGSQESFGI